MRFEIQHVIRNIYDSPVFIEPITIRLRPRCDWLHHLGKFDLQLEPQPDGLSEYLDPEGNGAATAWFTGLHRSLSISAVSNVEVGDTNPFDFILTDESARMIPVTYSQLLVPVLAPYLSPQGTTPQIEEFLEPVVAKSGQETIPFLTELALMMHGQFTVEPRQTGGPLAPTETLTRTSCACRDLAALFVECCRTKGLAARFVSGYGYRTHHSGPYQHHLHAWAEVYLPGGGWRGFDPSLGLATSNHHVPIAAAANSIDAAPTKGTYRGTGIGSRLEYSVSIDCTE